MSWYEALILGIIQGITEFLPVSSSGHLELGKALFGSEAVPAESMQFTVVVHGATALSTIFVFRKDIAQILVGLLQFKQNESFYFSLKIILSMIPAAAIGVLFNEEIEALFSGQILLVGAMLAITGLLLFLADRAKQSLKTVSFTNALLIGIAQAIAILPGISRSGATIATSVLLGIDKSSAARFSFLMVVPLIVGKMAKDVKDGAFSSEMASTTPLLIGFLAAFVVGVLACTWMIQLVKKSKLKYFSYYCFAVGVLSIIVSLL